MRERSLNGDAEKKEKIVYTYKSPSLIKGDENEIENITLSIDTKRKLQAARRRYWALGHTGPKREFDSWPRGGNAYPKWKRREPSGHYNCGYYRP